MRLRVRVIGAVLVIGLLVVSAGNLWSLHADPPFDAIREHAARLGFGPRRISTLGAGWSTHWLSWQAYGRFRVDDGRELDLRIERPHPLAEWRVRSYTVR